MRRLLVVALLVAACAPSNPTAESTTSTSVATTTTTTQPTTTTSVAVAFAITSPAFDDGGEIPSEYTCDGGDISPELRIDGIPLGTVTLVLIVDDPDAALGTWDHWVSFDVPVPGTSLSIASGVSEPIGTQGVNSWNLPGYLGPCPPEGSEHHYSFRIYALDGSLGLPSGVGSDLVYEQMEGKVIDSTELVGVYAR